MLTTSTAFSELLTMSLTSLGAVAPKQRFDMSDLLQVYDTSISVVGKKSRHFTVDVSEGDAQLAWSAEFEKARSKFLSQFVSYGRMALSLNDWDPVWAAVTGYYSTMFAANALLLTSGRLNLRLLTVGPVPRGLWTIRSAPIHGLPGWVRLTLRAGVGSSHKETWKELVRLFTELSATPGLDAAAATTLQRAAELVVAPSWLSDFRNEINYSAEEGPWSRTPWSSELPDTRDIDELESRICNIKSPRPEQRVELTMLLCGVLVAALVADQAKRTTSLDLRPHKWRVQHSNQLRDTTIEPCLDLIYAG